MNPTDPINGGFLKLLIYFLWPFLSFSALPTQTGLQSMGRISSQERLFPPACGCKDCSISSTFGLRKPPIMGASANHSGCDLRAPLGTELTAVSQGVVKKVDRDEETGYGKQIEVEYRTPSGTTFTMKYAHLQSIEPNVTEGSTIPKGQKIGLSGSSGTSTGPHLHLEVHVGGEKVDPLPYFDMNRTTESCESLRQDPQIGPATSTSA